jgi:two-component system, OmpR family, osmolarity sensor histidine kinase EnvZ
MLRLKPLMPRSLMGRALLIILIPLVVVQAVALQVFYGSHLNIVSRRLSTAVVGEIVTTIELLRRMPDDADQAWALQNAWDQFELSMHLLPGAKLPLRKSCGCRSAPIGSPTCNPCWSASSCLTRFCRSMCRASG